jgi:hypothetical protein
VIQHYREVQATRSTSTFSCTVETDQAAALRSLERVLGIRRAIRNHVEEETAGYAADLTRKLQARIVQEPGPAADGRRLQHSAAGVRVVGAWE